MNDIRNRGRTAGANQDDGLEEIMKEFRIGEKKSNLMQLNMNDYFPNNPVFRIANLLEQSTNLSNRIYRVNFDPVQEIVLKKMITEDMLSKRLILEENDFFKGILMLNYYCAIISRNHDVVDSLYKFAVQLEKKDRHKDPMMKDILGHVLQYSFQTSTVAGASERGTRTAYNSMKQLEPNVDLSGSRFTRPSPIYEGAARILKGTITSLEQYISKIDSRIDLNALIFTDAIYPYILSDPNISYVDNALEKKNFFKASVSALQIASKKYYSDHIDKKFRRNYDT